CYRDWSSDVCSSDLAHVAFEVLAPDDEGIDAHDISQCTGGFLEHRADIAEAKMRLFLDGSGHLVVGRDPELPGADQDAVAGRDFHAVAVAGERRPDPLRCYVSHRQATQNAGPLARTIGTFAIPCAGPRLSVIRGPTAGDRV